MLAGPGCFHLSGAPLVQGFAQAHRGRTRLRHDNHGHNQCQHPHPGRYPKWCAISPCIIEYATKYWAEDETGTIATHQDPDPTSPFTFGHGVGDNAHGRGRESGGKCTHQGPDYNEAADIGSKQIAEIGRGIGDQCEQNRWTTPDAIGQGTHKGRGDKLRHPKRHGHPTQSGDTATQLAHPSGKDRHDDAKAGHHQRDAAGQQKNDGTGIVCAHRANDNLLCNHRIGKLLCYGGCRAPR